MFQLVASKLSKCTSFWGQNYICELVALYCLYAYKEEVGEGRKNKQDSMRRVPSTKFPSNRHTKVAKVVSL